MRFSRWARFVKLKHIHLIVDGALVAQVGWPVDHLCVAQIFEVGGVREMAV